MTENERKAAELTEQIDALNVERNKAFWAGFHAQIANDTKAAIAADQKVADFVRQIDILKADRRAFITRGERCGHELAATTAE